VDDFEQMWRTLMPIGRDASSGGYFRQPFTAAEREAFSWFAEQCQTRGLDLVTDAVGNLVAWWRPESAAPGPGVLTGSHLDSVLDGGAFDGPLGVVSGLAAIDVLRDRGFAPRTAIGVGVFIEEEGSRFGLACLGSRLATGATTLEQAKELRDGDGVFLLDAIQDSGASAGGDGGDVTWTDLHSQVGCFVELHVEQGRDLIHRDSAVGVASAIWPHGRYRFDFAGEANHAGTTRMEDRRDPMLTYAMTALAANKQARLAGARGTFGRVEVRPNGTNAVPSAVTAWLDARAESEQALTEMLSEVTRLAAERATRDGTTVDVTPESVSGEVTFTADLSARISALGAGQPWPIIPTMAGHDAGVMSSAGVPTAMLFVRNPTGISHSPDEHADMGDCLAGVSALADTLELLAS
jgi:N-carbamoyl-L-amino-acid hydrolase